jgi:hypothetical protein
VGLRLSAAVLLVLAALSAIRLRRKVALPRFPHT